MVESVKMRNNRRQYGMRKKLLCVLVMVLLASAVSLAITPAAADIHYEIPGDISPHDDKLTKDELVSMILPYMLDKGDFTLDDVGDAAHVYTNWNGEPKMVMEADNREVMFYRPIERVVSTFGLQHRVMIFLGACDRLVGVWQSKIPEEEHACGGKLLELPKTGRGNPEFTASLHPDVVIGAMAGDPATYQMKVYTPCLRYGATTSGNWKPAGETGREQTINGIRFYGGVMDMQEEAEEVISYINEQYDKVTDITSQIPDSEKPRACDVRGKVAVSLGSSEKCIPYSDAGAISARADLGAQEFSVEQLVKWNPDVLFIVKGGGGTQSITIEQLLADPQLQTVNAVKTGSVYYIPGRHNQVVLQRVMIGTMYMAKIYYPAKFKDLDLEKEGNEIYKRLFGEDNLFSEYADTSGTHYSPICYFREFINNPPEEGKWQNVPE